MTKSGVVSVRAELDRGLTYAEACFETFRVIDGHIFGWQAHMSRLQRGLTEFGITLPEGLKARCLDAAAAAGRDALIRLTVSGGRAAWGLAPPAQRQPCIYIQSAAYHPRRAPLSLRTVRWPFPLRQRIAKFTADYAETLRVAQAEGGQSDALLVCDEQYVYSGTMANVLVYRDGCWWTPGRDRILAGVVRNALVRAGVVVESDCPLAWLKDCTAMALTSSGAFIRSVASINGRPLRETGMAFAALWRHLEGRPGVPRSDACA